jgi:hydrogenase maturation protein HypF
LGDGEAIVSEHLGDLGHPAAYRHFIAAIERLQDLYDFRPEVIAHDLHPRYLSTEYAQQAGMPLIAVQHHHAHIASVMAEHDDPGRVIGLSCDGTGYGTDGAIWGCELLHCAGGRFERLGHLGYVPLVGGDLAAVENWRPAAALLRKACPGEWERHLASLAGGPSPGELKLFEQQLRAEVNCPLTSSLGRLFDAVAFLIGVSTRNRHEAEAALALEAAAAAHNANTAAPLAAPFPVASSAAGVFNLDPVAVVRDVWRGSGAGEAPELLAARFHETIAAWLATTAATAAAQTECRTVALSGGCFLNRLLLDRVVTLIEARGLVARYQRAVPPGDGGLSLGQALVAAWQLRAAPTTAG